MGIFSKKKTEDLVLLFDIGSSSVGAALFYKKSSGVPEMIYSRRESITLETKINIDRFLHLTIEALKIVANDVCMKGFGTPAQIYCVLSSPWHASQTRVIRLVKDEPVIFTQKLADELIAKEVALFEEEHKHFYEDGNGKATTIELKNMKTILNGYEVINPYGQKAKEIEMSVFVSMVEEHITDMIVENINRHFRSAKIKFISFVMASSTVARDMFVHQDNFLLVNIGGEVTDISMIKKDIIRESISFPMGRNFMVRGLALELGVDLRQAETYLSLYKDEHLDDATLKKIEPAVSKIKTEWLKNFQDFLSTLSNDISIPSTVFITVEKDLAKFFGDIIKTEQFNQYILTESKFRVIFLGSQELHGIAILKDHVERDPFLVIESIYINHFLG